MRHTLHKYRHITFMLLALVIGWLPWLTGREGMIFAAPLVAALCVAALVDGVDGVMAVLKRIARWRIKPTWYLLVLLMPACTSLVAIALHMLTGGDAPRFPLLRSNQHLILLTWVFYLLPWQSSAFLEEVGLRGYAQEEMQNTWGPLKGTLALGVYFGAWLLPEFLRQGTNQYAMGGLAFLPWFILTEVGWSLIMAWVYNKTGKSSLVAGYLFHTAFNVWPLMLLTNAVPGQPLPSFDIRLLIIHALVVGVSGVIVAVATKGRLGMAEAN